MTAFISYITESVSFYKCSTNKVAYVLSDKYHLF